MWLLELLETAVSAWVALYHRNGTLGRIVSRLSWLEIYFLQQTTLVMADFNLLLRATLRNPLLSRSIGGDPTIIRKTCRLQPLSI